MIKFLIAYSPTTGTTDEIAGVLSDELRAAGHEVDVEPAGQVYSVGRYNAIILGSAAKPGHWDRDAVRFLKRHADALSYRRLWLFQRGPSGDAHVGRQLPLPPKVRRLAARIGAESPVTFGGPLEPVAGQLGSDHRDWYRVRVWARTVEEHSTPAHAHH